MSDPNDDTGPPADATADDDVYRIASPQEEPPPPAQPETQPAAADDVTPAGSKRRKKRRRNPANASTPEAFSDEVASPERPDALWQEDDRFANWKADTGWRDPTMISALWYPFTGNGWRLVPLYALLLWASQLVPFPILNVIIQLLVMSLVSVLLLETANFALEEIPGGPQSPDWLSWSTISVGLTGIVAILISGVPLILATYVMSKFGGINAYVQLLLTSVSLFYVPMAFLALAELENETALNPLLVLRGMRKTGPAYFIACGIAAAVFAVPTALFLSLDAHPFITALVLSFLLVYTGVALMRAVALLAKKRLPIFGELEEND